MVMNQVIIDIASRTFIRLLWFIELLEKIFENIIKYEGSSLQYMARQAYDDTLAKHHAFWERTAVKVIFITVPSIEDFYRKTFRINQ